VPAQAKLPPEGDRILTDEELQYRLGRSKRQIKRLLDQREIGFIWEGRGEWRRRRIRESDVTRYLLGEPPIITNGKR
jgi:hypothetical protein